MDIEEFLKKYVDDDRVLFDYQEVEEFIRLAWAASLDNKQKQEAEARRLRNANNVTFLANNVTFLDG